MTGIVLAGGKSRRLGRDKALLSVGDSTLIERVIGIVSQVVDPVMVISNPPEKLKMLRVPVVADLIPNRSALGGIFTGLSVSRTPQNLFVACDLPFVSPDLLRLLIDLADGYDVVIPQSEGGYEPLCAVYSKNCLDPIRKQMERGDLRVRAFFPNVKVKVVDQEALQPYDPEEKAFFNINTDEEYRQALHLLGSGGPSCPV